MQIAPLISIGGIDKLYIKKRTLIITAIILVIVTSAGTLFLVNPFGIADIDDFLKLRIGIGALRHYYYEEIDSEAIVDGVLAGAAYSANDPYTVYMPSDTAENYMESVDSDEYTGVGLYISSDMSDNTVTVVSALSGSPAEKAGITTGDKIIAVDGEKVYGDELDSVAESMKGRSGTEVTLSIIKKSTEAPVDIKLTRALIKRETVEHKMVESNIGYIKITQFGINTYDEFVKSFNSLVDDGMERLVIDLRNNPGGYMEMAVNIADTFIEKGNKIVYTMNRNGKKHEYNASDGAISIPIAFISNGGTASASEILIGALKDNDKAILVGEKTYGKGVTQIPFAFSDKSIIKITDSRYYTPNGKCIDKEGIEPDFEVKMSEEKYSVLSELSISEDEQLMMAVERVKSFELQYK